MVEANNIPDGWGTEEDSNQVPTKACDKSEPKAKVMGGGFWADEQTSSNVTAANETGADNSKEQSAMAWAEESDK